MRSRFDLIAQQLLQKPLADCSIDELQDYCAKHPDLAAARFLLAKKMTEVGHPEVSAELQKAALYYHQPASFSAFFNAEFAALPAMENVEEVEENDEDDLPLHISLEKTQSTELPVAANPPIEKKPVHEIETVPIEEPALPGTAAAPDDQFSDVGVGTETLPEASNESPSVHVAQPDVPAFEPYHTVDYFASQGIQLSKEEAAGDKVGRQMKSFTQWLKTMKRLPAADQLKTMDPHAEQKVEHLAAHSVAEAEIVTEAMAEVWIKQGNWQKAAEVYGKLSLSNPSKRAYFAAKLESLKKQV